MRIVAFLSCLLFFATSARVSLRACVNAPTSSESENSPEKEPQSKETEAERGTKARLAKRSSLRPTALPASGRRMPAPEPARKDAFPLVARAAPRNLTPHLPRLLI